MAEWSNAAVLKTVVPKGTGGSNPSLSARLTDINYIKSKIEALIKNGKEPEYNALSVSKFIEEFDYAAKYLSRLLNVRPFIIYILFFKRAYFQKGKRIISIKVGELGENLLSDRGSPMSYDVVKKGIKDLAKLKLVLKTKDSRPGQINEYEIKLLSEIREVQEMIKKQPISSVVITEMHG